MTEEKHSVLDDAEIDEKAAEEKHSVLDDVDIDAETYSKKAEAMFNTRLSGGKVLALALALVAVLLISFCLGRYSSNIFEVFNGVREHIMVWILNLQGYSYAVTDESLDAALFNIRLPRIVVVVLVGAALSIAGASYQGMFKNPLVSPDLLGASGGASFGACLAMLLNMPNIGIQLFAFVGGIAAVACVLGLNHMIRGDAILGLVLGGILVSSLFSSGSSIIKLVADADDKLPAITFWLMGSFAGITFKDMLMILPVMLLGFVMLLSQRWKLNVLSFGEEEAKSLGVNTARTRLIVIVGATLLTSCSVAVAGVIGYVGLVVPHLARAVVGPNYKVLLPTTIVIGAVFLLVVDNFARMLFAVEIPIGLLTSILGIPFFVFIYRRNLRGW